MWDAGKERCMKREMHVMRDLGLDVYRKGVIQDWGYSGLDGYRKGGFTTGGMLGSRDAEKVG